MKQSTRIQSIFAACLLALLLPVMSPALLADEKSLEETLRRMESLLQQQQEELEAQRKELAEQRELIRQLQEKQQTVAAEPALDEADKPSTAPVVVAREVAEPTPDSDAEISPVPSAELAETEVPAAGANDSDSATKQARAELTRREQEGTDQVVTAQTSAEEDPANTAYDPDFPGAWHLPGTTASMKISGYVNLALVNSFDPMLISDRFIVGSIPPEGQDVPGAKSGTDVTANQTRINYEVREETRHGTLRAFIEADFEGDGDTFRLRHAFGQYRWALAGKTWSTLMDIESRPEEVDFEGINGMILARQAQIRLFPDFGQSMSFKLGLEDPSTNVVNGVGARGRADVVMSVDRVPLGEFLGDWNSRVAVILRDLEADQVGPGGVEIGSDETYGWGITTSGRTPVGWGSEEDSLLWQVTYGKGIGRYINDLNTVGGGDAVFDPEGNLKALPIFAGYVSYRHTWAKDFWFLKSWPGILRSNLTYSWVAIDTYDFQADLDYKGTQRFSANMIYLPTQNLRLGVELLWGERKNKDNSKGTAAQLQVSARYNF